MKGGRREGSGRPRKGQEPITVRVDKDVHDKLREMSIAQALSIGDVIGILVKGGQ